MQVGVGFGAGASGTEAARLAAGEALRNVGKPVISFLFHTPHSDPLPVLGAVRGVIPRSKIVGACVPGIIGPEGLIEKGVGVLSIGGDEAHACTWLGDAMMPPYAVGEQAGLALLESGIRSGTVFVFPDAVSTNVSLILRGLYNVMGPDYSYAGAGTGHNLKRGPTCQMTEMGVANNGVAVALVGGVTFRSRIAHGWRPMGQPMVVTRAAGKRVYELDGIPAFRRYSEVLGGVTRNEFALHGMRHPLGIYLTGGEFLVRDPIQIENDDSITFITEVPQNTVATIMEADTAALALTARDVSVEVLESFAPPKVALYFDCVSRYLLMASDFSRETGTLSGAFQGIPSLGVLSFGEVSDVSGSPLFHNKSVLTIAGWDNVS